MKVPVIIVRAQDRKPVSNWELIKRYGRVWHYWPFCWRAGLTSKQVWYRVLVRLWYSPDPHEYALIPDIVHIMESQSQPVGHRKVWGLARALLYLKPMIN